MAILRPSSDLVTGGWTSTSGTLASCIDETTASDSDYIETTGTGNSSIILLGSGGDPGNDNNHKLSYRASSTSETLNVDVVQMVPSIVTSKQPWRRQPQGAVGPNKEIGVLSATTFSANNWQKFGGGTCNPLPSGMAFVGDNTDNYALNSVSIYSRPPLFIVAHFRRTATAGSGAIIHALSTSAATGAFFALRSSASGVGVTVFFRCNDADSFYEVGTDTSVIPMGYDHCVVGVVGGLSDSSAYVYVNGKKYNSAIAVGTLSALYKTYTNQTVTALKRDSVSSYGPYSVYSVAYGAGITESLARNISLNPNLIFRPRKKVSYFDAPNVIATRTPSLTSSPADYSIDLTSGEAAAITDYTKLGLRFRT